VLSDLLTIIEYKGGYKGLKIAWIGDGNNMSHSWLNAAAVLGLHLVLACPEGYDPDEEIFTHAETMTNGTIVLTKDPVEAIRKADVVYTDVWASMGQESEHKSRKRLFASFQLDSDLLKNASKDAIVMHCLPAHRGEEITDDVLEGPQSVVWDQAENKLHMNKAVLKMLIDK
jgi:ornithine carbamoyltransferase